MTRSADCCSIKPDFGRVAREEFGKWFVEPDVLDHILDGLRKGGLEIPAQDV